MVSFFACSLFPFVVWRSGLKKTAMALVILIVLANIIGTSYRGAILGLVASGLTFCFFGHLRHKWLTLGLAVMLVVSIGWSVYLLFPGLNVERLTKTKGREVETVALRKNNVLIGLEMAADHPIIGNGPDGFLLKYYQYARVLPDAQERAIKAHNTYVQVLAEHGIIGLTIFGLIIGITLRNLLLVLRRMTGPDHFMILAIFSALVALSAMMIGGNMILDDNLWTIIALGGAADRIYRGSGSYSPPVSR
jgi:O-antigen ligase